MWLWWDKIYGKNECERGQNHAFALWVTGRMGSRVCRPGWTGRALLCPAEASTPAGCERSVLPRGEVRLSPPAWLLQTAANWTDVRNSRSG